MRSVPRDPSLTAALAESRRITRTHGTSYYLASQFLEPSLQDAIYALYGFVRRADDLVDLPGPEEPATRLTAFTDQWKHARVTGTTEDPVLHAALWVVATYSIPDEDIDAFLAAMRQDLTVTRYETYADLERYMYGSAAVVGRMLTRIFRTTDAETLGYAEALGNAMQLTNFLRDIREDLEERGRVYLPQEDLVRFSVSEDDLVARRVTPAFRKLMAFQIDRARALYAYADRGIPRLPAAARPAVSLARVLYAKILDRIEQADYDVFSERLYVPIVLKAWYALPMLAPELPRRALRSFAAVAHPLRRSRAQ